MATEICMYKKTEIPVNVSIFQTQRELCGIIAFKLNLRTIKGLNNFTLFELNTFHNFSFNCTTLITTAHNFNPALYHTNLYSLCIYFFAIWRYYMAV